MDKYLAYLLLIYLCLHELNTLFKRVYLVLCKLHNKSKANNYNYSSVFVRYNEEIVL